MDAQQFAAEAIGSDETRTENVERVIRFSARASRNRGRTELEMLRSVARNHGYIGWKLAVARDEWVQG